MGVPTSTFVAVSGVLVGMEVPPGRVRQAGSGLVNVGRVTVGP